MVFLAWGPDLFRFFPAAPAAFRSLRSLPRGPPERPFSGAAPLHFPPDFLYLFQELPDGLLRRSLSPKQEGKPMIQLNSLTLREKVGQLFMIRPDALDGTVEAAQIEDVSLPGSARVSDSMREAFAARPCGGFALFRKNIESPDQLRRFTEELHGLGAFRPLLGIDEEGGRVARIGNHPADFGVPKIPPMESIGLSGDPEQAYAAGKAIGEYLAAFGLDLDFAPVADVNTNPDIRIIGNRAFGSDPEAAAPMVRRYVEGLHAAGIKACVKHFPGHGDASADTHTGYAESLKTWEEISRCEMIPFRAGIEAGAELVMAAHIAAPRVTGTPEPASLSSLLLTGKLRGELGFRGVIITDALAMGAVRQHYSPAEACIAALKAGADILLMPYGYAEAFDGVLRAAEAGAIPPERIDESVRRILQLKKTPGIRG